MDSNQRVFLLWVILLLLALISYFARAESLEDRLQLFPKSVPSNFKRFEFRFLTNDLTAVDGRPVFSPDGEHVVFMRQPNSGNADATSTLYRVKANGKEEAKLLFDGNNPNTNQPFNATRPDYSWEREHYQIAFDAVNDGIWLLDVKTKKVRQVLEKEIDGQDFAWSYPAWYRDGKHLAVTNYNTYGEPLYHVLVKAKADALNEFSVLTDNQLAWPGEATVRQKGHLLLAFAGQGAVTQPPPACTCPGGCSVDGYAQNCNQIWILDGNSASPIDTMQGRAPWFSPNGKYIVFESNRDNPDYPDRYRLYVYSLEEDTAWPITPPALNVQHAKWSPNGKRLAFAVQLFDGAQGIAIVDLE